MTELTNVTNQYESSHDSLEIFTAFIFISLILLLSSLLCNIGSLLIDK